MSADEVRLLYLKIIDDLNHLIAAQFSNNSCNLLLKLYLRLKQEIDNLIFQQLE